MFKVGDAFSNVAAKSFYAMISVAVLLSILTDPNLH
jgi:hypothetical protein